MAISSRTRTITSALAAGALFAFALGAGAAQAAPVDTPSVAESLNPILGPVAGGTPVTIDGTGFLGATGVTFDGLPGTGVEVLSDTMLVAISPPHGAGLVDVIVRDPAGDSASLEFEYGPQPSVVTALTPTSGTSRGGTTVTVTGTGFTGAIGVVFAGLAGTDFAVVNDTTLTVVTPAQAPGTVDVIVLDAGGDSAPVDFEVLPVPPTPVPPTPVPPSPESPGPVVPVPESPVPESPPDSAVSPSPGLPELPATGGGVHAPVAFASLAVVAGGVLVLFARRRTSAGRTGAQAGPHY